MPDCFQPGQAKVMPGPTPLVITLALHPLICATARDSHLQPHLYVNFNRGIYQKIVIFSPLLMDANPSILQGWKQAIFLGIAPPSPHNLPLAYVYIEAIPYVDLGVENNRRGEKKI
jgi:hypothetical protein